MVAPPHPAPTPAQCAEAVEALSQLHGKPRRGRGEAQVLCAVVQTILSQNTTAANSRRAMERFTERFGRDYAAVRAAPLQAVVDSIACAGLGNIKGRRIQSMLADIEAQRGEISLEHLRTLDDAAVQAELTRFKGIGPKTASCVLLFCLGRDSFAVDTHVHRISKRLGWVPAGATREAAFAHLDARVPARLKHALHVLLVRHGKTCPDCAAHGRPQFAPRGPCPLKPANPPA